jgi:hypothetical protein
MPAMRNMWVIIQFCAALLLVLLLHGKGPLSLTTMVLVTGSKDCQSQEEGSFSQGKLHKQDVPLGYSGHHCSQEPALFSIFLGGK